MLPGRSAEGVRRVKVLNYNDCFELSNAETRVTLSIRSVAAYWNIRGREKMRSISTRRR